MGSGSNWRKFKALMKKNFINWKRTPCGSITEIVLPVLLMLILVYARSEITAEEIDNYSLYSLRHSLYPAAKPDVNGNYTIEILDQLQMSQDMTPFMRYADYININQTIYLPVNETLEVFEVPGPGGFDFEEFDDDLDEFLEEAKEDVDEIFDEFKELIQSTPIANLSEVVNWDAIAKILGDIGLGDLIDVEEIKEFVENVQETLENPEQSIEEFLGFDIQEVIDQVIEFDLDQFQIPIVIEQYVPLLDITGPYLFYPSHCFGKDEYASYDSPVIAYVETGSEVEKAVVKQLEALFENQRNLVTSLTDLAENDFITSLLGEGDGSGNVLSGALSLDFIREDEITSIAESLGFNSTDLEMTDIDEFEAFDSEGLLKGGNFTLMAFASTEELDAYIADEEMGRKDDKPAVCYGFKINEDDSKKKYELELFFNDLWLPWYQSLPSQNKPAYDLSAMLPNTEAYTQYSFQGFSYMQNWVANTILKHKTGDPDAMIVTMTVPQKMPKTYRDDFQYLLKNILTFFILVMYIPPLYRTVYRVVAEKESRVKESMKMMGLKDAPYWLSWYCYYTIVNTLMSLIAFFILEMYVLERTAWWIHFFAIWLFGQSLFGILLITQSLFIRARAAAISTSMVFFSSSLFQQLINEDQYPSKMLKYGCCLSPTVAMIQTFYSLGEFEAARVGNNINTIFFQYNDFSVGEGLIFLAIDVVWLLLFGLYMEQVMPKTYGARRSLIFCLTPSFWGCCKKKVKKGDTDGLDIEMQNVSINKVDHRDSARSNTDGGDNIEETMKFETQFLNAKCYEKIQIDQATKDQNKQRVKITNLNKTYDNGFKAVNGINLKMFQDQIFVLLGHNGAGKTSTISMLTGLFTATKGQAEVFGHSIFDDIDEVRSFMGVCPQHDVLFELLTPEEHLDLFYEFKGGDKSKKKTEIEKLMLDIGVSDKRKSMAYQLSGGNKRKLSVAIALCADSKFVLLDEPTSGLDISARRQLWDMLKEYKRDRIVLLTTHYMDEADILGDRIGIMNEGKLTCVGSSLFLKNRFGAGYVMTLVKDSPEMNTSVVQYLKENLGHEVHKLTEIQGEMTVQIPASYTSRFQDFFTQFDNDFIKLGIRTYGLSVTTLEQVFLEIGQMADPSSKIKNEINELPTPYSPERGMKKSNSEQIMSTAQPVSRHSQKDSGTDNRLIGLPNRDDQDSSSKDNTVHYAGVTGMDFFTKKLDGDQADLEENCASKGQNDIPVGKPASDQDEPNSSVTSDKNKDSKTSLDEKSTPKDIRDSFNLADSKLNEGFCYNLNACLLKRFNNYRRNRKQLFNEVALPSIFMFIGVMIANVKFTVRSPSKIYTPDAFPLKQKILINDSPIDPLSDVSIADIVNNMDGSDEFFEFTYEPNVEGAVTFDDFAERVYQFGITESPTTPYQYSSYEFFEANSTTHQYKFINYVNITSAQAVGYFPQFMYEAILKTALDDPEFEFKVRSTPYPLIQEIQFRVDTADIGTIIFFAAIAFSILITVTVSYVVVERVSMLKHMQAISGMTLKSYWISNFIFDAIKFYIVITSTIVLLYIYEYDYESSIVVLVCSPFGILPFTYVFSYLFTVDSAAQTFTMFLHFTTMLVFSVLVYGLRVAIQLQHIGDILTWALKIIPSYCIPNSFYFEALGSELQVARETLGGTGGVIDPDPWALTNNMADIIAMGVHFVFWIFILFLIEIDLGKRCGSCYTGCCMKLCCKKMPKSKEIKVDDDVLAEEKNLLESKYEDFKIKVTNFKKIYMTGKGPLTPGNPFLAVENISFGLKAGECFALLGVNGAGKSTTFKSLTNEISPTQGTIRIANYDIKKNFDKVKKMIGYCPQTNPIFDHMTVWEHVDYFARIKGIPASKRKMLVDQAIDKLGLAKYRDKFGGNLSGGNKRKLSVAIAIVGSPPIILLDEPSAGMDPEARRFMWQVVADISSSKTSAVVLTTHSMEEAEALSTKMGIMVKGGIFKCFGSSQHIKDKFGDGYIIEIKASIPESSQVLEFLKTQLSITGTHVRDEVHDPVKVMTALGVQPLVQESILKSNKKDEGVPVNKTFSFYELVWDILVQNILFDTIHNLCVTFDHVEIIEQFGNYLRLRIDREDRTIGSIFKQVEQLKQQHSLQDYSVSQTTLEQIFQGFADLKFDESILKYTVREGNLVKV